MVAISAQGQPEVSGRAVAELNQLDAALAVADNDEGGFDMVLAYLLRRVRAFGTPVPDQIGVPSEAILPPPDNTIAECARCLTRRIDPGLSSLKSRFAWDRGLRVQMLVTKFQLGLL